MRERISVSARLWTHGYNIYTQDRLILFPLCKSKTIKNHAAKTHFSDHQDWLELNRLSMVRVHMLLNALKKAPKKYIPPQMMWWN